MSTTTPRRCAKAGCSQTAAATLTYAYADSCVVVGPLALHPEPGSHDLCRQHAVSMVAPRGWEIIRLPEPTEAERCANDDLLALADAVREDVAVGGGPLPRRAADGPARSSVVEIARRGHLTMLADAGE